MYRREIGRERGACRPVRGPTEARSLPEPGNGRPERPQLESRTHTRPREGPVALNAMSKRQEAVRLALLARTDRTFREN